jgi:hypothetical protein
MGKQQGDFIAKPSTMEKKLVISAKRLPQRSTEGHG